MALVIAINRRSIAEPVALTASQAKSHPTFKFKLIMKTIMKGIDTEPPSFQASSSPTLRKSRDIAGK